MCYWLKQAGLKGGIAELALRPGLGSGRYKPHIRKATGMDRSTALFSDLVLPGTCKTDGSRTSFTIPVLDPHVAISNEVSDNPSLVTKLAQVTSDGGFPDMVMDHPVAKKHNFQSFPVILYVDGVPTTKRDAVIGFWLYMLGVSDRRHLVCVVRKSRLCKCGCRGWCTCYIVFRWLHWSFDHLAQRKHPVKDSSGMSYGADGLNDELREALGGEPISVWGALGKHQRRLG